MGTISKGILGGFSGKVGTVVGGNWKGIDYMRSKGKPTNNANASQSQLAQQIKFALCIRFLQSMSAFLALSFRSFAVKKTGINAALSFTLKNAISGAYPNFDIHYPDVLVSRGDLPNVLGPTASMGAASQLNFVWTDNAGVGIAKATDKAMLLAYCPDMGQAVYTTGSAGRSAGADSLNLGSFTGRQVHTYICFISEDQKAVATSIYTGPFLVS